MKQFCLHLGITLASCLASYMHYLLPVLPYFLAQHSKRKPAQSALIHHITQVINGANLLSVGF